MKKSNIHLEHNRCSIKVCLSIFIHIQQAFTEICYRLDIVLDGWDYQRIKQKIIIKKKQYNKWVNKIVYCVSSVASDKESACNAGDTGGMGSIPRSERPLEEGLAPHSSILAWRISWTEKPGKLQSMESQRVRHEWSEWACKMCVY